MSKWLDHLKEKQGRKGLVPWLSFTIQKIVLIGVVIMAALFAINLATSGGYFPYGLIFTAVAIVAFYVGVQTKWLNGISLASKPIRITGAIIICAGVLAVIIYLAIMVIMILVGIFILFCLLCYFLGGGVGDSIKQDGKTYHRNINGDWDAEKDWLGNDKVDRDLLGNPKIETDWAGNQKIEKDWNGNPIIPPDKRD